MAIRHKRTTTLGKVPLVSDLVMGQLALNVRDGRLFALRDPNNDNNPQVITLGAEMSSLLAAALKETTGAAFLAALGITSSSGLDLIETKNATGTEVLFTGLGGYRDVMFVGAGVQGGSSMTTQMQVGSAGGYLGGTSYVQPNANAAQFALSDSGLSARSFALTIHNFNRTDAVKPINMGAAVNTYTNWPIAIASATALDRARFYASTGSFSAGTITAFGRPG